MSVSVSKEMKTVCESVLWREGVHLVAHSVACMPQTLGGFKKMDVVLELEAHRAKWGVRYLDTNNKEKRKSIVREWIHEAGAPLVDVLDEGTVLLCATPAHEHTSIDGVQRVYC